VNDAVKKISLSAALLLILAAGLIVDGYTNTVEAVIFNIGDIPTPTIDIRVGAPNSISRVTFNVLAGEVGTGIPVDGSQTIDFRLRVRATAANPLTAFLTVDSATPLDNGSGGSMPTSEIEWTSDDGEIPSGSFLGLTNQPLASFTSTVRVTDTLTFKFKNQNVYDAGNYNGTVTYTWAAP